MKKNLLLCGAASLMLAMVASGCVMCNDPINDDPSCIESTHATNTEITPNNINYSAPSIVRCTDVFKPVYEAGKERVTAVGIGNSLEEATGVAIANFMEKTGCDFIVGTNRIVTSKTHPTWRLFATSNYTVTISGIPVTLSKVVKVEAPKAPEKKEKCCKADEIIKKIEAIKIPETLTKEDVKNVVVNVISTSKKEKNDCPFGLIKLTDINVKIDAKATASDAAAVKYPAPAK